MRWGQLTAAALIGFLLGLGYCYWKAIKSVYQNREVIGSAANFITAGQDLYGNLQKL